MDMAHSLPSSDPPREPRREWSVAPLWEDRNHPPPEGPLPLFGKIGIAREKTTRTDPFPGMVRLFLLSPANCGGRRASMVMSDRARFELALRLRDHGAPLGEVFSFMSGLYFRGKLAYARAFAR